MGDGDPDQGGGGVLAEVAGGFPGQVDLNREDPVLFEIRPYAKQAAIRYALFVRWLFDLK